MYNIVDYKGELNLATPWYDIVFLQGHNNIGKGTVFVVRTKDV